VPIQYLLQTDSPNGSNPTIADNTSANTIFTSDTEGVYTLSLVVNDGKDNSIADTLTLTILPSTLKKTGQSTSYDTDQKDDGAYQVGIAHSYTRELNGTDTVTDNVTGLIWQDDSDAKTVEKTWQEAIDYCNGLDFAGSTDWRLPTIDELVYITDKGKVDPAMDSAFENVDTSSYYWSATTYASYSDHAWNVHFKSGNDGRNDKGDSYFVRCVR